MPAQPLRGQLTQQTSEFVEWGAQAVWEESETCLEYCPLHVVVLAVNFMGAVFVGEKSQLLQYGAGIALPIAALGLFVGLRAWSLRQSKQAAAETEGWQKASEGQDTIPQEAEQKVAGED